MEPIPCLLTATVELALCSSTLNSHVHPQEKLQPESQVLTLADGTVRK